MTDQHVAKEQFSPATQHVLALAREEATTYRQALIGTEHVLLGLIQVPQSVAAQVLAGLDVTLARARDAVELIAGYGQQRTPAGGTGMTERTNEVLVLAERLSRAVMQPHVEPLHILLALLDVPGNAALSVLQTLGVERDHLHTAALAALGQPAPPPSQLTHLDTQGHAHMVDVGAKADTQREGIARGSVVMQRATLQLIMDGNTPKGDVLATARIAGIIAAKRTSDLIPLCHPLMLTHVSVEITPDEANNAVQIEATVRTMGKTGVEMEALTAVSVAALTIYDMCKAVDRAMRMTEIRLAEKHGGKSGSIVLE